MNPDTSSQKYQQRLLQHGFAMEDNITSRKIYNMFTPSMVEISTKHLKCRVPFGVGQGKIVLTEYQMRDIAIYYIVMRSKNLEIKRRD